MCVCVLILAICFALCPLNNIIDLFKGYKNCIDLKFEINLTSLTKKFTNNKRSEERV